MLLLSHPHLDERVALSKPWALSMDSIGTRGFFASADVRKVRPEGALGDDGEGREPEFIYLYYI